MFKVPLGTLLQWINCSTQLGVMYKLAEGTLDPTLYVIDKDIK